MDGIAELFENHRGELHGLAYRMLGSAAEADDAVQETWLRLAKVDADEVRNLAAWLRTVASRVCLDLLRARAARREDPVGQELLEFLRDNHTGGQGDPERDVVLAESVGRAMLVVLDALAPAERVAFVLHDVFAVPFEQIAPIVERTPDAAKKLASRARRRVRGVPSASEADVTRHRRVIQAFLDAARGGDLPALLAVLAPDVVRCTDALAVPPGVARELRGADAVAKGTLVFGRRARYAELALVDGEVGVVVAPRGRLVIAMTFRVVGQRIARYDVITDPASLRRLSFASV